jgi:hypothetical protein
VTSIRKIMANRANARRSTGPKTRAGKASSSRNALRHGFGRGGLGVGGYSNEVEALAREIAGRDASCERYEHACRIAAAQLDLVQVRLAKLDLQTTTNFACVSDVSDIADRKSLDGESLDRKPLDRKSSDRNSPDWNLLLPISRLDRYEQRALTRRRRAIHDFDALSAKEKPVRDFCGTKPT